MRTAFWSRESSRGDVYGLTMASAMHSKHPRKGGPMPVAMTPGTEPWRRGVLISRDVHTPVLAKDILRYISLFAGLSLAPAVAMAKAEVAERGLRLLSIRSRHVMIPLL